MQSTSRRAVICCFLLPCFPLPAGSPPWLPLLLLPLPFCVLWGAVPLLLLPLGALPFLLLLADALGCSCIICISKQ